MPADCQAVLLATNHTQLLLEDNCVDNITMITTNRLRSEYKTWIDSLNVSYNDEQVMQFIAAIKGVNEARAAYTFEMFARFVQSVALQRGKTIPKAVDGALHILHLPKGSGNFKNIPNHKVSDHKQWKIIFKVLKKRIRPLLFLKDVKGKNIQLQVTENYNDFKDSFSIDQQLVIKGFLNSDLQAGSWNKEQQHLAEQDWTVIKNIFYGVNKSSNYNLNSKTRTYLLETFADYFDKEDSYILSGPLPKKPGILHFGLYYKYKQYISTNSKLAKNWENYLYRIENIYHDVFVGIIVSLHHLRASILDYDFIEKHFVIRIPQGSELSNWKYTNSAAAKYLALSLHGLEYMIGDKATLDLGKLWDFYIENPHEDLININHQSNQIRPIKLEVEIDPKGLKKTMVFYWNMPAGVVASAMHDDMNELLCRSGSGGRYYESALLATSNISRQSTSMRGRFKKLKLSDVQSFSDAEGNNNGRLISHNQPESDLSETITAEMDNLEGIVEKVYIDEMKYAFNNFSKEYTRAIKNIVNYGGAGFASLSLTNQANKYSHLLTILTKRARNEAARKEIWKLILSIGTAQCKSSPTSVIITPWHPLRLAELSIKTRLAIKTMLHIIDSDILDISRSDLLLRQINKDLTSTYFPEQCVCQDVNGKPLLLTATESNYGYTLCEDVETKGSSYAYVTKELVLKHSSKITRRICSYYLQLNSLPKKDFTKRRIRTLSQIVDGQVFSEDDTSRSFNIVSLVDVLSKHSSLVWKNTPIDYNPELLGHIPSRVSIRRQSHVNDKVTTIYLTSPYQPLESQIYLNTLYNYLEGSNARNMNVIPALELNFGNTLIRDFLKRIHTLGEWVVIYDSFIDHKQLQNNGFQIINQRMKDKFDRDITVSTTVNSTSLHKNLEQRIQWIDDSILHKYPTVISKLIAEASQITDNLVLMAALDSVHAGELLGLVLSKEAMKLHLGKSNYPIGWFSLDNCSSWFGRPYEQIADIMALSPRFDVDGKPFLNVFISETKFVSDDRNHVLTKSMDQLISTVDRISKMLGNIHGHKSIERELLLNLLGDLMIDGIEPFKPFKGCKWDLYKWSTEVRNDNIPIKLSGLSHIFLTKGNDVVRATLQNSDKTINCSQCTYSKAAVRVAIEAFASGKEFPVFNYYHSLISNPSLYTAAVSNQYDHQLPVVNDLVIDDNFSATNDSMKIDWFLETKMLLMKALQRFEMSAESLGETILTPNTAMYLFKGSDSLTVANVLKRNKDLLPSHTLWASNVSASFGEVIIVIVRQNPQS